MMASLAEALAGLDDAALADALALLDAGGLAALIHDWRFWARPNQLPPPDPWVTWLILAGRGFGKTRTGAEWVRLLAEAPDSENLRIALVADTLADARAVMVEGESGLMAISPPGFRPVFEPSKRRLVWPGGAQAFLYSAEAPEQLRGPQHHAAWCDELAKWRHLEDTWHNLQLGLRLGDSPQAVVTTTPRPVALLKALMADPATAISRGSTFDNRSHLPAAFLRQITEKYAGTRLGRQEIDAEIIDDVAGALWTRALIEAAQVRDIPPLRRMVVGVDPPVTAGPAADACGIVVAGLGEDGLYYVVADCTLAGATVHGWARAAVAAYHEFEADRLVAEVNNGGDLVAALIAQVDASVSYRAVRASRGKWARAEPVAALYEQGRVRHTGRFPALEDEMATYVPGGTMGMASPDRMDALVWAITDLMASQPAAPRLRRLA